MFNLRLDLVDGQWAACREGRQIDVANRQGVPRTTPRQSIHLDNGCIHTGLVRHRADEG